jgi:hypothetical protein
MFLHAKMNQTSTPTPASLPRRPSVQAASPKHLPPPPPWIFSRKRCFPPPSGETSPHSFLLQIGGLPHLLSLTSGCRSWPDHRRPFERRRSERTPLCHLLPATPSTPGLIGEPCHLHLARHIRPSPSVLHRRTSPLLAVRAFGRGHTATRASSVVTGSGALTRRTRWLGPARPYWPLGQAAPVGH